MKAHVRMPNSSKDGLSASNPSGRHAPPVRAPSTPAMGIKRREPESSHQAPEEDRPLAHGANSPAIISAGDTTIHKLVVSFPSAHLASRSAGALQRHGDMYTRPLPTMGPLRSMSKQGCRA